MAVCNSVKSSLKCIYFLLISFMTFNVVNCIATKSNVYKRTDDRYLQNNVSPIATSSSIACCGYCDQAADCMSVSYKKSTGQCDLSTEPFVAVKVNGKPDTSWSVYSKNGNPLVSFCSVWQWLLVFRATPGAGGDVYTAWMNGTSVTTDDVKCMTTDVTSCSRHYRNPIVDSWESVGMTQAKFAFYKSNVEVAYVTFNATGSDVTDWFNDTRIIESSWSTIKSDTFIYFSILGHVPSRRFFINRNYGGCPADAGYAVAVTSTGFGCSYDIHASYPQFLYANSTTYGHPESMTGMDIADVMAIYIK